MKQATPPTTTIQKNGSHTLPFQACASSRLTETDLDNPGFGSIFSDHMFSMEYRDGSWTDAEIIPFDDFSCSPAMATLHYGQTIFEGMKAFHTQDGEVQIFRPHRHFERLNRSCRRMCIPETDPDFLVQALKELISVDREWVPKKQGNALYIRPLIFATDPYLGVRPSRTYRMFIMTSPVGAYYKEGINPVSLTTTDEYIRAVRGGSGFIKTACNYGPTLLPALQAQNNGYTQILWLDAHEHKYIEEVGTMNIFFKIGGKLITPGLGGSILGGVTRDSAIVLAREWGVEVEERPVSIDEVFEAHHEGELEEVFGTGTAAVISPVGSIHHNGKTIVTDEHEIGPFARRIYDAITGIQYGSQKDIHQWMSDVK